MSALSSHPHAALEYWFFKVNSGPVALLVDWIARRKRDEHIWASSTAYEAFRKQWADEYVRLDQRGEALTEHEAHLASLIPIADGA